MRWIALVAQYVSEAILQIFFPDRDKFPKYGFEAFKGEISGDFEGWPERPSCRIDGRRPLTNEAT
ncbi:MAG: hypothetical protein KME03_11540 [Aphanocapsa lilacina HA4352-LM1]|jgi:hypothetical protein|nr:hypothetical protein [Aphanocapsa lilacina HA4352-LM1]